MNKGLIVVLGLVGLILILTITSYNGLVGLEETADNMWAQVEVQYQRRADLIPNLVNTVEGIVDHEKDTFSDIAALRSGYAEASTPGEYTKLDQQLTSSINVAVEAYPELKANESFQSLMDELSGTENRIAVARRDYNNSVMEYNKKIRKFPTNMYANLFGFDKKDMFEAAPGTESAPTVNFGS